jgi:hypothetical protein
MSSEYDEPLYSLVIPVAGVLLLAIVCLSYSVYWAGYRAGACDTVCGGTDSGRVDNRGVCACADNRPKVVP